jgi:hypothetical protein
MKFFLGTIFLILGLTATASFAPIPWGMPNGCAVVAREYEAEQKADRSLREHQVWARIVCFSWRYKAHAICVFAMSNGDVWSYDHVRGSNSLGTQNHDVASISAGMEKIYGPVWDVHFIN